MTIEINHGALVPLMVCAAASCVPRRLDYRVEKRPRENAKKTLAGQTALSTNGDAGLAKKLYAYTVNNAKLSGSPPARDPQA